MPTLKELHEHAVDTAIDADPRDRKQVENTLEERKEAYEDLDGVRKEEYPTERLENPYDDSNVYYGGDRDVSTLAVGIDIETQDLLLVDRIRDDRGIDGVITHHPVGRGLAQLPNMMAVEVDVLTQAGIPVSQAEGIIGDRVKELRSRFHPQNHPRAPRAADLLDLPFASMHTVTDNHAYRFVKDYLDTEEPDTLGDMVDALLELEEFRAALKYGVQPELFSGSEDNRVGNFGVLGFTGGTDVGGDLIECMVDSGVDTLVAMHATGDQIKLAQEHHINVVSTGHFASDALGLNIAFDHLQDAFDIDVVPLSGFKRVERSV